ncbi:hypothetical protein BH09ACT6_BH09ACT6_09870 [soil metagenome]
MSDFDPSRPPPPPIPPYPITPPLQSMYNGTPPAPPPAPQPTAQWQPTPPPPEQTTNVLAIISLATAFFFSVAGIVAGHIALSQIKRTGEKGHGLAIAGLIIGYARLVMDFVAIIFLTIVLLFGLTSYAQLLQTGQSNPIAGPAAASSSAPAYPQATAEPDVAFETAARASSSI